MNKSILSETLEEIESDFWVYPENSSNLVATVHSLRKKRVADFSIEDMRMMIGQQMG